MSYNNGMDINEQTDAFTGALDQIIDQFQREFDLNVQTIVGVLEDKKLELLLTGVGFETDMQLEDQDED